MASNPLDKLNSELALTETQAGKVAERFKGLVGPELTQAVAIFKALYENGVGLDKALVDGAKSGKDLGNSIGYAFGEAKGLYQQLKDITSELNPQANKLKAVSKAYTSITDLARQLSYDAEGVTDMDMRQLTVLKNKLAIQAQLVEEKTEELLQSGEISRANANAVRNLREKVKFGRISKNQALEELRLLNLQDPAMQEVLAGYIDGQKAVGKLINQTDTRLQLERNINENMGVTGALVKGTGALMERLGMRSGIFHQAMEDAAGEMREMAKAAGQNVSFMNKLKIAAAGFSKLVEGFGPALFDPAVLVGNLVNKFLDLNKAQTEFIQLTGQSYDSMAGLNTEVATLGDLMEVAAAYTKQTGLNAAGIFTPKQLGNISDAQQLLGLSAEEASSLGSLMKMSNQTADQFTDTVLNGVTAMNAQTGAAVANKAVLQDVLGASDDIKASFGGSSEGLMKAAHAARKLGLDIAKVNSIADGLLDFESSIESELEAQLLTGKQINLSKARELALNNDLEGVANELAKNGASAAEFAQMNRIQQESMAKALGMSREEMGKMLIAQTAQGDMTDEQRQKILGVNAAQLRQMDIQSRIQKSVDKISEAFAPVLEALVPILESLLKMAQPILAVAGAVGKVLASFLKLSPVVFGLKLALAGFAAYKFTGMVTSALSGGKAIAGLVNNYKALQFAQRGYSMAQIRSGFGGSQAMQAAQMTRLQTVAVKLHVVAQKAFNFVVGLGQRLMNGLGTAASFVGSNILKLSRFLGVNTIAQKASNVATRIGNFLANSWLGKQAVRVGAWIAETIGIGANTVAKFTNTSATAAQAAANATLATSQTAVGATGAAAGGGLAAAGAGLGAFGAAAAPAIPILLAIGAALLMASPAIYAIGQMIVGLATVIGNVLIKALEMIPVIIDSMVNGFATVFTLLTENIGTLFLMGPALFSVGAGLFSIAAGLGMIAIAGIAAIPALAALSTFAIMVTPLAMIGGLFGGGDEGEDSSMAEISAKLDTLISVVSAGGNVYLDGDKVGEAQVLGTYKLS